MLSLQLLIQAAVAVRKDASLAPDHGDVVALLKVTQLHLPQPSTFDVVLDRCLVQKSDAAALNQHLLADIHVADLKHRMKVRQIQILPA